MVFSQYWGLNSLSAGKNSIKDLLGSRAGFSLPLTFIWDLGCMASIMLDTQESLGQKLIVPVSVFPKYSPYS